MAQGEDAALVAAESTPADLFEPVSDDSAWRAADIGGSDIYVPVSREARRELGIIAAALADYEGPLDDLYPDAFDWPATVELMVEVRTRIIDGTGAAILDRLPVEDWSEPASRGISWLLNVLLAPPIMQKWKGHRVYDVRDTGAKLTYGVRRSVTNLPQEFHTDGSFLKLTPDYMSLVCVRPAMTGGLSRIASLSTAHNALAEEHPEHLARLYEPYWWDRQAEHAPEEQPANWLPVFQRDGGRLSARYYDDYIRNGYKLMKRPIDEAGDAALRAMQEIVERPENWFEFRLEPGQIEFLHNRLVSHGRTGFRDAVPGGDGRLMLRFWLRTAGGIGLEAELAPVA